MIIHASCDGHARVSVRGHGHGNDGGRDGAYDYVDDDTGVDGDSASHHCIQSQRLHYALASDP